MLSIRQLSVAYGESTVVRDVDLDVKPGQIVCLMGRNGVGKTTVLKASMGLLRAQGGSVSFDGRNLTRTTPDVRARAGIGYVPQGREIFPHLTVEENLKIGLMANPARPKAIPEDVFDFFPMLKTMLHRKGGVLSGGQQQQLAIGRALVADPKLLILDEPTEGIQPSIISLIGRVLESLKSGGRVAVLLVEQYFEFAVKLADYFYVMEKGKVAVNGAANEIDKETVKGYLSV
jgi:urea transport system ATP-binding protein